MNSQRPAWISHRKELQGSRPCSSLKIRRDSQKIRKSAPAIPPAPMACMRPEPVIVYMRSPKIIHVEEQDFMSLVQRLTGKSSSASNTRRSDHSIETENLTSRTHDSTVLHQAASTARRAYQPVSSRDSTMIDHMTSQEIASGTSEHGLSALTPPASSMFSALSPNTIFQDDHPHMIPNSDYLFYSPWDVNRSSEPFFSRQRSHFNSWTMIPSPSLISLDLYKTTPEY